MLNIHKSPLLAIDFNNGLGEGVRLDQTHFLLSYMPQRKAPEVRICYNSQLQCDSLFFFSFKTSFFFFFLIVNDSKVTVILTRGKNILIRWTCARRTSRGLGSPATLPGTVKTLNLERGPRTTGLPTLPELAVAACQSEVASS